MLMEVLLSRLPDEPETLTHLILTSYGTWVRRSNYWSEDASVHKRRDLRAEPGATNRTWTIIPAPRCRQVRSPCLEIARLPELNITRMNRNHVHTRYRISLIAKKNTCWRNLIRHNLGERKIYGILQVLTDPKRVAMLRDKFDNFLEHLEAEYAQDEDEKIYTS